MKRRSQQLVVNAPHRPPENEVPVVITSGILWRSEGAVMAVPSLLVYTTGIELLIMYRVKGSQTWDVEHVRATSDTLRGLTANGRPVELLGGQYLDHGFTYRAWIRSRERDLEEGIDFSLEWPGFEPTAHRIDDLRETTSQVIILWPP
jgi:hypothetical protein